MWRFKLKGKVKVVENAVRVQNHASFSRRPACWLGNLVSTVKTTPLRSHVDRSELFLRVSPAVDLGQKEGLTEHHREGKNSLDSN